MTETEWPASDDPGRMLYVVQGPEPEWGGFPTRKITDRKLRLFACGCCRLVWDGVTCGRCSGEGCSPHGMAHGGCDGTGKVGGLTDPRSRNAVEVAERYADGGATGKELNDARNWAMAAWHTENNPAGLARYATHDNIALAARRLASREWVNLPPPAMQADLLRCVVGNPFRPVRAMCGRERKPFHIQYAHVDENGGFWLEAECGDCLRMLDHNGGTVRRLAEAIYADRAFDRLPILADALEEAGCDAAAVLSHCRGPGPHARGCWVVDLILGKE